VKQMTYNEAAQAALREAREYWAAADRRAEYLITLLEEKVAADA